MMIVLSSDSVSIVDSDDCTRLHVATTLAPGDVDSALRTSGTGRLGDDGTAHLDLRILHSRARAVASADDWSHRWQTMVEYASSKGWVTPGGDEVKAHIEFDSGPMLPGNPKVITRQPTADVMREILSYFASGIVVISGRGSNGPLGFTCQSFASLSLEPPLVSFSPARTSTTWPGIREIGELCVNILAEDQVEISNRFARSGTDKFSGVNWFSAPSGAPVLEGVSAWIDCTLWEEYNGGDHTIALGRVNTLGADPDRLPLLYYRSAYGVGG